jgi:NAD(P)-dependent dehydrogenase (short-subunit alcohol dehydrogenase family)
MAKQLGKIAVVSGGTGSLGRSVVLRLVNEGHTVIVAHKGNERSRKFISDNKREFHDVDFREVDVESESSVRSFFEYTERQYGRVDVVCALVGGVIEKKWIEEVTFDEWEKVISLNLHSCFLIVKESVRLMKKNRFGRIVTIGAKPALPPEGRRSGYDVAKSAVIAFTQSVSQEVKQFGDITINAIVPGTILTDENIKWGSAEEIPKWITPDQIADKIIDLCSEKGIGINGQIIQMYGKE